MNTPTRNVAPITVIFQQCHFGAVTREVRHD